MKNTLLIFFPLLFLSISIQAQDPFNVVIEPVEISELGGLQSFAFGQHEGKWLLVGGRLDGLHRRQPWASFDIAGHNNQLIVVDPESGDSWTAPLSSLPASVEEQLSSTNMNFHQEGNYLYCIGGYGFSTAEDDHTTFPYLTAIDIPQVIEAIINNLEFESYFRQIEDSEFQVTGGRLRRINDVYHLLGGQKFLGRYNPMNNPTFTQEYTNQIRRFTLEDDGTDIEVNHLVPFTDNIELHRRDYNAEAQILPNGEEGITMFSGVFQPTVDLPFLTAITVDENGYAVEDAFQQYYNHYHCASVPIYSEEVNEMHTVFFGGIAQYYESDGALVQDNNVPFVKTVARVTRDADGNLAEYRLPLEMPDYLGAGSEFIPLQTVPRFGNDVIKLDHLSSDSTLVGYIFGGINSTAANIFWVNDGTQSTANDQIFKVYLTEGGPNTVHELNEQSNGSLQLVVYPNPNFGELYVEYQLQQPGDVKFVISDVHGKVIEEKWLENQVIGTHTFKPSLNEVTAEGVFLITLETSTEKATQRVILKR